MAHNTRALKKISIGDFPAAIVVGDGAWITLSNCWPTVGIRRWRTAKYARLAAETDCAAPHGCKGAKHHCVFGLREPAEQSPPIPPPVPAPAPPVMSSTEHTEKFAKMD